MNTLNQGLTASFFADKELVGMHTFATTTPLRYKTRVVGFLFPRMESTGVLEEKNCWHDNRAHFIRFLEDAKKYGFFILDGVSIPFAKVTSITESFFDYHLPIAPVDPEYRD